MSVRVAMTRGLRRSSHETPAAIKVKTQDAARMDHARRNFKEIEALFPIERAHALGEFGLVYKAYAEAKMLGLNAEERLSHHIEKSAPVMERLFAWRRGKLEAREIEPYKINLSFVRTSALSRLALETRSPLLEWPERCAQQMDEI